MNECVVTQAEIMDLKHSEEWAFMLLLKEKGVPMTGLTLLRFDPDYIHTMDQDFKTMSTRYRWKKRE